MDNRKKQPMERGLAGGCNNCRHHCSTYLCTKEGVPMIEAKNWWDRNGKRNPKDKVDDMPCFDPTNIAISLDKMSMLLDKMIDLTKKP